MTIQNGKYYLDREGNEWGPAEPSGHPKYPWALPGDAGWTLTVTNEGRGWSASARSPRDLVTECDRGSNPINTETNTEHLDELRRKYKELGETIERLERKPLTWADIKDRPGTRFRLHDSTLMRIVIPDERVVWLNPSSLHMGCMAMRTVDRLQVILQDKSGKDLPPEKQVVR